MDLLQVNSQVLFNVCGLLLLRTKESLSVTHLHTEASGSRLLKFSFLDLIFPFSRSFLVRVASFLWKQIRMVPTVELARFTSPGRDEPHDGEASVLDRQVPGLRPRLERAAERSPSVHSEETHKQISFLEAKTSRNLALLRAHIACTSAN